MWEYMKFWFAKDLEDVGLFFFFIALALMGLGCLILVSKAVDWWTDRRKP